MQCPGREFHGRWAASPQPWTMKGWMWVSTVQEGEVNGLSQKWPLGAYVTWLYCGGKKIKHLFSPDRGHRQIKEEIHPRPALWSLLLFLHPLPSPLTSSSSLTFLSLHRFASSSIWLSYFTLFLSPPSPLQATELVERCCLGLPHLSSALPC